MGAVWQSRQAGARERAKKKKDIIVIGAITAAVISLAWAAKTANVRIILGAGVRAPASQGRASLLGSSSSRRPLALALFYSFSLCRDPSLDINTPSLFL